MTKVLVTGATTPLGSATVRALAKRDDVDVVLAVGIESEAAVDLGDDRSEIHYQRVDLARPRQVRELLFGPAKDLEIDAILHAPLHRSARDLGRRIHALNVESTRQLMHQAERHPTIRRFVLRSHAEIYAVEADKPTVFGEDHPINFSPSAPQWLRDRIEADLMVCARMGMSDLKIAVLRATECVGPNIGSQLYDYLRSRVCLRPMGYDPLVNVISIPDLVEALVAAVASDALGVFNIGGADTLPLSAIVEAAGRTGIWIPGPALGPLYRLRQIARGTVFRYDLNHWRFHFSGVPDGRRAKEVLGYEPSTRVDWSAIPRL